jgi:DNA-binding SARP family transcriptional activator
MTSIPSDTLLRLRTLGPTPRLVRVTVGGGESLIFGPGKPLAMLIYLSMRPERTTSRNHLTDLLWADSDLEHARQSLRQAIWQVRRKLGDQALVGDGEQLTLQVPLSADYHEVGAALRDEQFEEAVRLYEGDFLSEFGVPGGAGFEHWADRARDRLRSGWMRALEALARDRRERGALREAVALTRRLRDADPHQEAVWRFLLETLLLAGDPIGAGVEADTLESLLAREQREPEPQTAPFLARVRAMPPAVASSSRPALTAELIGREGEFRRLTQAYESARGGAGRHVHISAPAGLGKTRLLRDAERRLRAVGGRVLYLRASSGSRHIAYAFAAELARAMISLPGASGVAPSVMSTILALDPSLAARYQGSPDPSEGAEALRRRTLALADMILALGEESPLALLIDDVHWMDRESLHVLTGLLSRVVGSPTLFVTSARPFSGREAIEADAELISLSPLVESQVEALVMSLGPMSEARWPGILVHHLHDASGGSPHLILESLQLALDRGWLVLGPHGWSCLDPTRIAAELPAGDAIRRRLDGLESAPRLLLTLLAIAATPLTVGVLAGAAGMHAGEALTILSALELRGFVSLGDDRWRPGHDQIAEVLLQGSTSEVVHTLERRLGVALGSDGIPSLFDHQRAAELLISGGDESALAPLYLRRLAEARQLRDPRSDAEIARVLMGASATPARLGSVLRARPFHRRLGLVSPGRVWGAAAAVLLTVASIASALARGGHQPSRMVLLQTPLAGDQAAVVPIPILELQDASGRRVRDSHIKVRVEVVGYPHAVQGLTTVSARDGLATFDRIAFGLEAPSGATLRFTADSLPAVNVRLLDEADLWLRLEQAEFNGQTLSEADRVLRIHPGEIIRGSLTLRYSAVWPAASVLLVAVPTWGDKRTSFRTVGPLATPAKNAVSRQSVTITGPTAPGDYLLIFAFAAETDGVWIASGTNWKVGTPVWGDGNDLADLTNAELTELATSGRVHGSWLFEDGQRLPLTWAGTSIVVQVR